MISFNFSSLQIYIWYYWNLLLQLRFRRLFRLVCARMSAVSNSCCQACGHQRLRLLCISCSRLQSGRVWSGNEHTLLQHLPSCTLVAKTHRLSGHGPTGCGGLSARDHWENPGPGPNHRYEQQQRFNFTVLSM